MARGPRSGVRLVVWLGVMVLIGTPIAAQVKVEEQVVGPLDSIGFIVSDKGVHFAASALQGSRSVLIIDGVESPKFDDPPLPPAFSADGSHFAYVGRQGDDFVVFLDGKELVRGPSKPYSSQFQTSPLHLTPTGKRLFYGENTEITNYRCVVDGKPGPTGSVQGYPVFSRDESRYAYAMQKLGRPPANVMIVDGKEHPYAGDDLSFTGDGKSVISVLRTQGKDSLMVDGKPLISVPSGSGMMKAGIEKYVAAPAGALIATIVRKPGSGPNPPPAVLYLNDKPVPTVQEFQIQDVQFSPDGKRYAALCVTQRGNRYVVIDGKKGLEYGQVSDLTFTPDSSKVVYTARTANKMFVIVEDKESGPYDAIAIKPIIGGQGARIGFVAPAGERAKNVVVLDGVPSPPYFMSQVYGDALTFSPDGSRHAFFKNTAIMNASTRLMVDGAEMPAATAQGFTNLVTKKVEGFLFSPDGKFIAYVGNDGKGTGGVWVNDKLFSKVSAGTIHRPVFTPDSQHLIWTTTGRDNAVFVDGVEVMRYGISDLDHSEGAWEMGSDGVYQFLAPSDKVVKRYRLTPGPETGLAKLLAK